VYKKSYELKMIRRSYPGYSIQFDGREVPPHNLPPKVNLSRMPDTTPEIPKMEEMTDKHLRKFGSGCPNCRTLSIGSKICENCGHDIEKERFVEIVVEDASDEIVEIPDTLYHRRKTKVERIRKLLGEIGLRWWQDFDEKPFLKIFIDSANVVHDTVTVIRTDNEEEESIVESQLYDTIIGHFDVNRNPKGDSDDVVEEEYREIEFVLGIDLEELEKMKKKELQNLCDENDIVYKKKDTNDTLLKLIKKENDLQNNKQKRSRNKQIFIKQAFTMARDRAEDENQAVATLRRLIADTGFKDIDDIIEEFREENKKKGYIFGV